MTTSNNPDIADIYQFVSEYHFQLGKLETRIAIRIHRLLGRDLFIFTQSHFIHTPTQIAAYITNVNYGETEESTLRTALRTFNYYAEAVHVGHDPKEFWLVKNPDFW
jgi:hypothetical protein